MQKTPEFRLVLVRPRLFGYARPLVLTTNRNPSAPTAADDLLQMFAVLMDSDYRPRRGDICTLLKDGSLVASLDPRRAPLIRAAIARREPTTLLGRCWWHVLRAREADPLQALAAMKRGA